MAKNNKNTTEENIYAFSRSMKGYNPSEVEEYISALSGNFDNTIKVYENKVSEFKEENEIYRCENDSLKQELAKRKKLILQLQQETDNARKDLSTTNKKYAKVEEYENAIKERDKTIAKLEKDKEDSDRALLGANVDKKKAKEKLDKAKAEISELKAKIKEMQDNPDSAVEEVETGRYVSNDEDIQQMIGAYSLHLMKTRKILDSLIDQISNTEGLF